MISIFQEKILIGTENEHIKGVWILVWTHTPFVAIHLVSVFMKTSSQDPDKIEDKKYSHILPH